MTKIMKGVIHVTGEHDTGKTTFALECGADPLKICFLDDDIKGRATVEELQANDVQFGAYHDLAKLSFKIKLLDFHNECIKIINSIVVGQYDVIIWDTWSRFAVTCGVYARTFPEKFRDTKQWASSGRIKGSEQNKEGTLYEAAIIGKLASLAPTVVLITHLKDDYLNNAKTGKKIPAHGKTLARVPRMRIWLRQNPDGRPVPIGLFLKRFDKKSVTENGLRTECVVPRKITPQNNERSLWDTIWRYWDNPVGDRKPTEDELPNEYELSILDGTLTQDQRRTFDLMLKSGLVEKPGTKSLFSDDKLGTVDVLTGEVQQPEEWKTQVKTMHDAGMNVLDIAKELGKPLPIVKKELGL